MVVSTIKMTAEQFSELGEDPVGVHLELVDGEIAVSPSAEQPHSYFDRMLSGFLVMHIREHDLGRLLGDFDTVVGQYTVRRPDILFFVKQRVPLMHKLRPLRAPPDLCVEIISPSSITTDRIDKFQQYAQLGVANYWIADPEARTIEAYQLNDGAYALVAKGAGDEVVTLPPFPDLQLPLSELWLPDEA